MQQVEVQAEIRTKIGSSNARRYRRDGKLPAVLYGHDAAGIPLLLDAKLMDGLLGSEGFHGLVDLKVQGDVEGLKQEGPLLVLVKSHQADPISRDLTHIDLYKVNLQEKVRVSVPFHVSGTAPGVKTGGILDVLRRELNIYCLPEKIPEFLEADVGSLELGDSIHLEDLELPEGVTVEADTNFTLVTVASPAKLEEAPAAEAVEGAAEGDAKAPEEKAADKGDS